jgi:hypothetical protein
MFLIFHTEAWFTAFRTLLLFLQNGDQQKEIRFVLSSDAILIFAVEAM